jgi:hypothetical protein
MHEVELLRVARDWQRELCGVLGLPDPQISAPIEIELGLAKDPGRPIDHAVLRSRAGYFGLVRIPYPDAIPPDDLRFALTAVLVRTAIYNRSDGRASVTEPPAWFVRGIARHVDRRRRGADFESAYSLWSCASLPGAGELWDAEASPADRHPEVAAQLVAWCGTREDRRERWAEWCDYLAKGGRWEAPALARIWNASEDLSAWDADWDAWMIARTRRVFDIGTTHAGVIRRFRSLLLLYPWECGMYNPAIVRSGTPLAWCVENPDTAGLRQSAAAKAEQLKLQGAGRDPAFQRMAAGYAAVLTQMAEGALVRELIPAWRKAESLRQAIEADSVKGGLLRPGAAVPDEGSEAE